jgi:threonine dehydratase
MTDLFPTPDSICKAHERIAPYVHHTPVLTCQTLNNLVGGEVFFKCENFQKAGAFKFRGATNAILLAGKEAQQQGVSTHSSGNHAQALALAARMHGCKAYIVMPSDSPDVKVNAVKDYGAEITFCEPTLISREETLAKVVGKTGAIVIHPYDDYRIIAGQATACKELLEDVENFDLILAPVGGGGLLSGTALSAAYFGKSIRVVAAEPEMANDAWKSFQAGKIIPSENPKTIADGLKTSLCEKTFAIIQKYVDDIVTVDEEAIRKAMFFIWERMKIVIEPSSAVPVAALLENKIKIRNLRCGIILSGGNVCFRDIIN